MGLLTHSNPFIEDWYTTRGFSQVAVAQLGLESNLWVKGAAGLAAQRHKQAETRKFFLPQAASMKVREQALRRVISLKSTPVFF